MHTPLVIKKSSAFLPHPWHPSVVYVKEGWNGHKWWMAQTPFPPFNMNPYRDRFELPCIHYSDDGIRWASIPNNPIDDLNLYDIEAHNYYSDPHLILVDGKLELYYRFTFLKDKQLFDNKTLLLCKTSSDGFFWSNKRVVADLREKKDVAIWGEQIISPALVWRNGRYSCYYVDRSSYLTGRRILLSESGDGKEWSKYSCVELVDCPIDPWHIDVQFFDGMYQLIVYDMDRLLWYESKDGLHFNFVSEVLKPSPDRYCFYSDGLYRACSVKVNDEIRVFFSAKNKFSAFIGQLKTSDRCLFCPVNGMTMLQWLSIVWEPMIKNTIKRLLK